MFLRIGRAPAQYVTDSSFVEQGVNQRGRKQPGRRGRTFGAASGVKSLSGQGGRGLGDDLSVRKVKAHTTPDAVRAGVISGDDRAGNGFANAGLEACASCRRPSSVR